MRPIELSLKGLHSFREKQTVDFSDLCKEGVFGIFGPTGSGKSSILDAMTLALYGKVERAPNNTQGIINQAENEVFVSFTFKLGSEGRYSTYRVERTYKRSGDNHVKTAVTRLHDLTTEPAVLADKAGEVNKKIETMLGLSIEDFTRAVVLPQGKFSEFLTLRGSDRRQMLQRIFQLEKYGDRLNKNIKDKLQQASHEKERIESEQHGLGQADETALRTAEKHVHYWEDRLQEVLTGKQEMDKIWEEAKQRKQWQEEWAEAVQNINNLEAEEETISNLRQALARSEEAEFLSPYAQAYLQAQSEKQTWEKKEAEARRRLNQAEKDYETASAEQEKFQIEKQEADKNWYHRTYLVDKAEEIEEEVTHYTRQENELKNHLQTVTSYVNTYSKNEEKMKKDLDTYKLAVEEFQNQQKELVQGLEDKYTLLQAKEAKHHITQLQHQYSILKEEEKEYSRKKNELSDQLKVKDGAVKEKHQLLEQRFMQLVFWYNKCTEELRWFDDNIELLTSRAEEYKAEENRVKQQEMAAHLAVHLTEGSACPVCGSLEHPEPPSTGGSARTEPLAEKRDRLEGWLQELKNIKLEAEQRKWMLQQLSDRLTEDVIPADNLSSATVEAEEEEKGFFPDLLREDSLEPTLKKKLRQWASEADTIERLQKTIDQEKKQFQSLSTNKTELSYQWDLVNKSAFEKTDQCSRLGQEIDEEKQKWHQHFPRFSFETLEEKQQQMQEQEEQKEKLQQRIDNGAAHIQELQNKLEEIQKDHQAVKMEQKEIETKLDQVCSELDKKRGQLTNMLGSDSTETLRKKLEDEKKEWEKKEQQIMRSIDAAQKEKQAAENDYSIAAHALTDAEKRLQSALQKWQEEKAGHNDSLENPEEVKQYLLSNEQKTEYNNRITQHDHALLSWRSTKEKMEQKLSAQHISEEEWKEIDRKKNKAHELVDYTREKRAAVRETLKDIQRKQERYHVLEEERKQWEQKVSQLQKLDQVFRGKGFIEFLAEEQLMQVTRTASEWLRRLTRGRYVIQVDEQGGFIISDHANAGMKRPVSSLSGGETFLTSLALALALSSSIQLKGKYPLEFFFLDEGFGTLDHELLDTVMTSLEKLQMNNLAVGIISHVPDIQERLTNKIIVSEAEAGGSGSRIRKEYQG